MAFKVFVQKGVITDLEVDALVNPTNNDLILGGDISSVLRRVGGPSIQEECNQHGTVPLGEVVVTSAGELKNLKMVLHAAILPLGLWADEKSIRRALLNCFKRLAEKAVKTVAFPPVGTGSGGFSIDRCAHAMCDEILQASKQESPLEKIFIVVPDDKMYDAFREIASQRLSPELVTFPVTTPS